MKEQNNKHMQGLLLLPVIIACMSIFVITCTGCGVDNNWDDPIHSKENYTETITDKSEEGYKELSDAAISIIDPSIVYDGSYQNIKFPMGDVDPKRGVCTDVVIRSYRKLGIDLQELIFTDMIIYPEYYNQKASKNISHRRVRNMRIFFKNRGTVGNKKDFKPGDLVTWDLGMNDHIGVVVDSIGRSGNYMVVHNIGAGQVIEDCLFDWKINGHYLYTFEDHIGSLPEFGNYHKRVRDELHK
mgnify:CR=1 FL=1